MGKKVGRPKTPKNKRKIHTSFMLKPVENRILNRLAKEAGCSRSQMLGLILMHMNTFYFDSGTTPGMLRDRRDDWE